MNQTSSARPAAASRSNSVYAWYVVVLLTLTYIVSFIDRYILSLLIEPIKASLHLTDFEMGLLIGPAFVILYVTIGIPIGWLADRKNRRTILAIGIALWSFMTAACGLVKSFGALFAARVGVGIGEASVAPCALSLISDYFSKETRPRAVGLWMTGAPIGAGLTYLLGGPMVEMINDAPPLVVPVFGELFAWQTAFLVVGLPGLILAALMYLTVKEPRRRTKAATDSAAADETTITSIRDTIAFLVKNRRAYGSVFVGIIGVTAIGAASFWTPALFLRTWGWDVGTSGPVLGAAIIVAGLIGTNFGGWLATRLTRKGMNNAPYLTVFGGVIVLWPSFVLYPLMPTPELAVLVLFVGFLGMSITSGTSPTAVITITPSELHGQAAALFWLVINLFGALVGPPAVGLITDLLGDPSALKYGVSITCFFFGALACLGLLWGFKDYRASATAMDEATANEGPS